MNCVFLFINIIFATQAGEPVYTEVKKSQIITPPFLKLCIDNVSNFEDLFNSFFSYAKKRKLAINLLYYCRHVSLLDNESRTKRLATGGAPTVKPTNAGYKGYALMKFLHKIFKQYKEVETFELKNYKSLEKYLKKIRLEEDDFFKKLELPYGQKQYQVILAYSDEKFKHNIAYAFLVDTILSTVDEIFKHFIDIFTNSGFYLHTYYYKKTRVHGVSVKLNLADSYNGISVKDVMVKDNFIRNIVKNMGEKSEYFLFFNESKKKIMQSDGVLDLLILRDEHAPSRYNFTLKEESTAGQDFINLLASYKNRVTRVSYQLAELQFYMLKYLSEVYNIDFVIELKKIDNLTASLMIPVSTEDDLANVREIYT